ncbi:MAG: hypothetical protein PHQ28_01390 [Mycobacterium sp.]|nr:hypothetical protein [Mycobacterium sp.]
MRASRIFNGVDRIDVEWTILGQRYQLPSMTLIIATIPIGLAIKVLVGTWVGVAVAAAAAAAVVLANWHLNRVDPQGALGEVTRVRLLWGAARRPYVTNTGRN